VPVKEDGIRDSGEQSRGTGRTGGIKNEEAIPHGGSDEGALSVSEEGLAVCKYPVLSWSGLAGTNTEEIPTETWDEEHVVQGDVW
jgi:hypothetical protein